jgi:hypothetical protein
MPSLARVAEAVMHQEIWSTEATCGGPARLTGIQSVLVRPVISALIFHSCAAAAWS